MRAGEPREKHEGEKKKTRDGRTAGEENDPPTHPSIFFGSVLAHLLRFSRLAKSLCIATPPLKRNREERLSLYNGFAACQIRYVRVPEEQA